MTALAGTARAEESLNSRDGVELDGHSGSPSILNGSAKLLSFGVACYCYLSNCPLYGATLYPVNREVSM